MATIHSKKRYDNKRAKEKQPQNIILGFSLTKFI